jgi:hypothetical protein
MKFLIRILVIGLALYIGFWCGSVFTAIKCGIEYSQDDRYESTAVQSMYYRIEADIYCLPMVEFVAKANGIFGEARGKTVIGITKVSEDGPREIYLPFDNEGRIDIMTLGHEIFYHVMHDYEHH